MHLLPVTSIYASIFAILLVLFSLNVTRYRIVSKTAIGDDNHPTLKRAVRIHGNFAEHVPIFLILLALNEMAGMHYNMLFILGYLMLFGRISHAYGVFVHEAQQPGDPQVLRFRKAGMIGTHGAIAISALLLLVHTLVG